MAYLNLTASILASAQRQGLTPLAFLEGRLAVWQYDFGAGEWPERLNITRKRDEIKTAYESAVEAAFLQMEKPK